MNQQSHTQLPQANRFNWLLFLKVIKQMIRGVNTNNNLHANTVIIMLGITINAFIKHSDNYTGPSKQIMIEKVTDIQKRRRKKDIDIEDLLVLLCTQCFKEFWLQHFNFKDLVKGIYEKQKIKIQKRLFYILYLPTLKYFIDTYECIKINENTFNIFKIRNQNGQRIDKEIQQPNPRIQFRQYWTINRIHALAYSQQLIIFLKKMLQMYIINQRLIELSNSCIEHLTKYHNKMNENMPRENVLSSLQIQEEVQPNKSNLSNNLAFKEMFQQFDQDFLDNDANDSVINETGNGIIFLDVLYTKVRVLDSEFDVTALVDNIQKGGIESQKIEEEEYQDVFKFQE